LAAITNYTCVLLLVLVHIFFSKVLLKKTVERRTAIVSNLLVNKFSDLFEALVSEDTGACTLLALQTSLVDLGALTFETSHLVLDALFTGATL
jgi:hypothetical protein